MDTYFANLTGAELTAALLARVRKYQQHIIRSGYWALGAKSAQLVCGMDDKGFSSFAMRKHGPRGEYAKIKVDEYASLYANFHSSLVGQKIVFEPSPNGEDWRASEQARKAKGVLEDALDTGFREALLEAVDHCLQLGMACTAVDFDPDAGEPALLDPDGGEPLMSGAMTYRAYMPQDAAFDVEVRRPSEIRWWILRRWEDAHELAARFPEREAEIMAARGGSSLEREVELQDMLLHGARDRSGLSSRVPLYELRHASTAACRKGRIAWFLNGGGAPLFADDLPFVDDNGGHRLCVRRLAIQQIKGTGFGFTPVWLLMAEQELLDMLRSIEATAYKAHGTGVILNPKGSAITPRKVGVGLAVIDYTPGLEPKPMNFTTLPPDLAGAQGRVVDSMQRQIGISSVDRGDPPPSVKSGSAMLFMKATSAQRLQPYMETIGTHHEGAAEDVVFLFARFMRLPKTISIPGDAAQRTEEVRGEDIGNVVRVKLPLGNPITHSMGGRVQIAENMLAQQAISSSEYMEIVDGAGLQKLLHRSTSQRILVEQENAMIRRGEVPLCSPTHDPLYHISHHALELNSQQALANPAIRQAALQHIQQHQQGWAAATVQNPGMLEALGIPLMQAALGAAMGPPPGPGAPAGHAPAGHGAAQGPSESGHMPRPPQLPPGTAAATGINPAAPGPGGGQ